MKKAFRSVARAAQSLSREECESILNTTLRGVLAVNGEGGYPYALPINHYYDAKSGKIYFHSGKSGYKVECLTSSPKASFTAMAEGERHEGEWWLTIKSVIAFGEISFVTDPQEIETVARKLSLKFTKDEEYIDHEIEKYLSATLLLSLSVEHLTGKVVREK